MKFWRKNCILEQFKYPANTEYTYMLIVWTDGEDNQSTKTLTDQNKYIQSLRKKGVVCLWTASGQDAVKTGTQGGFAPNHCLQTGTGVGAAPKMYRAISTAVRGCSQGVDIDFTQPSNRRDQTAPAQINYSELPDVPIYTPKPRARFFPNSTVSSPPASALPMPPPTLLRQAEYVSESPPTPPSILPQRLSSANDAQRLFNSAQALEAAARHNRAVASLGNRGASAVPLASPPPIDGEWVDTQVPNIQQMEH